MKPKEIQEAVESGRWRLSSDEEEQEEWGAYTRTPLTAIGQFISDTIDEEDPMHFIGGGAKPGHYRSFVDDIMKTLSGATSEGEVLTIVYDAFVAGFLPAIVRHGDQRYVVVEHIPEDYKSARKIAGRSELYEGTAKKIWNHVSKTKKD